MKPQKNNFDIEEPSQFLIAQFYKNILKKQQEIRTKYPHAFPVSLSVLHQTQASITIAMTEWLEKNISCDLWHVNVSFEWSYEVRFVRKEDLMRFTLVFG